MSISKESDSISLYLELLKKALSFSLYDKSITFADELNRRGIKKSLFGLVLPFLKRKKYALVKINDEKGRNEGQIWPSLAHTMIGLKRLDNIQFCAEDVIKNNIPGDFIETGVWQGGACILMGGGF
ncbi:MAG: hypothetical protein NTW60_02555 [Candidatus Wolfebacteria bacterium]|nr:hypothetical protein [Candidatus Wolfebacteria bacterium]